MKKIELNSRCLQKAKIFIMLLFSTFTLYAQKTADISGQVIDSMTGEPLIGVNVILKTHKIYLNIS